MKTLMLAACVALSLSAAVACTAGRPQTTYRSGPYDNTGQGPGETGMEGGGG
jgi:hypothetical protein